MKRIFCLFFLFLVIFSVHSQDEKIRQAKLEAQRQRQFARDTAKNFNEGTVKINLNGTTKYTDYKIITLSQDTTYIDTTLNINKHYQFNFMRSDNFELLPFHNIGQTFNTLGYSFDDLKTYPDIGFRAKQFFYLDADDIRYYDVPTPTSEVMFLTTLEQGQFLESFFTLNFSRRFNASIRYTGLRSLGKYRRSLVSQGNFRTSFRYESPEGQYTLKAHIATQDLLNEENGGLTPTSLVAFINDDENFADRARLDVNIENAENSLEGSRLFLQHDYRLLSSKDSVSQKNFTNLKVGHTFLTEGKFYEFRQTAGTSFLGTVDISGAISDRVESTFLKNELFLEFNSKYVLGTFRVKSALMNYTYGYSEIFNQQNDITTRKLEGEGISFGADWKAKVKNIELDASGQIVPGNGRLSGTNLLGHLSYKKDSLFSIKGSLLLNSKSPNFNFILHQSSYREYNWFNPDFDNIRTQDLGFQFDSKWVNASVNLTNIENYTYFGPDANGFATPLQASENVTYLKVKASKEFKKGKFALDNTIMYQNVSGGSSVFRVPEIVTRNTFYYSDYWFKGNPLQVQIGASVKYFSNYRANAYNPLLAEFVIQNDTEIGWPSLDLFFNAQVRRTRIYFRLENFSEQFLQNNHFSAPNYPYRDAVIRFGLVWNWFI
jgi:hypothetical protein